MIWEGDLQNSPVREKGWAQRALLPSENSPHDNLQLGGRVFVHWRTGPPVPTVAPVVTGFDYLHDEPVVDEEATKAKQLEIDEMINRSLPKVSKEEHRKRHLAYLQWAAPSQFSDFLEQYPEEAVQFGFLKGEEVETTPEPAVEVEPTPQVEDASPAVESVAADPASQVQQPDEQDLDRLLEQEATAEKAGDEERLAEIRSRIEQAMK